MSGWLARRRPGRGRGVVAGALALAACLLLSGCAGPGGAEAPIALSEADSGKSIQARQGALIDVRLKENPTTGYQWALDGDTSGILALQSSEYTPDAPAVVGGGGQHTFVFKASGPGTAHLRLKQWRSWEGDASIVARFEVTVQVRP